jgi:glycogen debranching enzyme
LLTPFGLRSLSPDSSAFRGKYMGSQPMRDLSYHQGTVWVWPLAPMAKTAVKIFDKETAVKELEMMIYFFREKYSDGEISFVPEIYDGDGSSVPKGAPAQCWSQAALFVIEKMIQEFSKK